MITSMNVNRNTSPFAPSGLKTWIALVLAGVLTAWIVWQVI